MQPDMKENEEIMENSICIPKICMGMEMCFYNDYSDDLGKITLGVFTCSILASIVVILTIMSQYLKNVFTCKCNTRKYCHNTCEYWAGEYTPGPSLIFLIWIHFHFRISSAQSDLEKVGSINRRNVSDP